jgi:hypothetical protein
MDESKLSRNVHLAAAVRHDVRGDANGRLYWLWGQVPAAVGHGGSAAPI